MVYDPYYGQRKAHTQQQNKEEGQSHPSKLQRSNSLLNTMESGFEFKICDYGFVKITEGLDGKSKRGFTCVGTPYYASPQILFGEPYSSRCDVFSTGVIFY
jgi:serine/threonine protein kinase